MEEKYIEQLITIPKIAIKADRKKMLPENRHIKNTIYLKSQDNKYTFKMFVRQSLSFIEDFSVGLIWTNVNECIKLNHDLILMRCQGPHDSKNPLEVDTHHSYHIHELTISDIEQKRYKSPTHKQITDEFSSFNEAITYFINKCAIIDIERYAELPCYDNQIDGQLKL